MNTLQDPGNAPEDARQWLLPWKACPLTAPRRRAPSAAVQVAILHTLTVDRLCMLYLHFNRVSFHSYNETVDDELTLSLLAAGTSL
jgi:hypothetical protein